MGVATRKEQKPVATLPLLQKKKTKIGSQCTAFAKEKILKGVASVQLLQKKRNKKGAQNMRSLFVDYSFIKPKQ